MGTLTKAGYDTSFSVDVFVYIAQAFGFCCCCSYIVVADDHNGVHSRVRLSIKTFY